MPYQSNSNTCIVFLVRHGATLNNLADPPKIQGHGSDIDLSDEGKRQASRTAELLRNQPLAAVFSSPLRRAYQTATIIGRPHQLEPARVADLREVDVGRWEGQSWREIERAEPDAHARFVTDPATYGYAGGENLTQLLTRVRPAIEQLMAAHLGQCLLVVGHNVVNRVLLATYMQVPLALARGIHQDNCGVNVLRYRAGQVKLLTANSAFHLHAAGQHPA